jgi:hypothetical protein
MRVAIAWLVVVLVPAAAAAQPSAAPAPPPSSSPETGATLELRYTPGSSAQLQILSDPDAQPDPRTELFAGYQLARLSFGVGLELGRASASNNSGNGQLATTYLVLPGVRAVLGRSHDGRADLIGIADVGWGETSFSSNDGFTPTVIENRFRFQTGPGLRYWPSPSLAFGVAALVRHDRIHHDDPNSDFTEDAARTDLAISLSVTGVF